MCLANINKTLLDILIVFSQRKFCSYINFELVEQIIAILGLIITTKSGIEFLNILFHSLKINFLF